MVDGRELQISQFLFDDALNDMIFSSDADYADAARHEEPFSESEVDQFTFDVEKLGITAPCRQPSRSDWQPNLDDLNSKYRTNTRRHPCLQGEPS
ncbi:hypothetical protein B5P45_07355 [Phyllobacterium zundukense]|uniref:Uncharacterized protein n=1 Tax=Phyllobacterium zundukense TaxID=1867719 RepID=A0A2N9W180_9HYPH|nr:hypothetical protein B5P45_07355 [Phyllobacterium zundukense]